MKIVTIIISLLAVVLIAFNITKVDVKFVLMRMKKLKEIKTLKNIKYGMIKIVMKETNGGPNIFKKINKN
jgi:uncharacterized integral membrane protein